jgi:hypothetical protein
LGHSSGDFFTNSSGHPVSSLVEAESKHPQKRPQLSKEKVLFANVPLTMSGCHAGTFVLVCGGGGLSEPGLPDGKFSKRNPYLGKFWWAIEYKILVYYMNIMEYFTYIWYILWPIGNIVVIWYIFYRFGILCQDKSGNPVTSVRLCTEKQ